MLTLVGLAVLSSCAGSRSTTATVTASLTWTQQHPETSPPARAGAAMAYDPAIGKLVGVAPSYQTPDPPGPR